MLPDLERLIRLQQLEDSVAEVRLEIDAFPAKMDALDVRIAVRSDKLTDARDRLTDHRTQRQTLEKELAQVQSRLTRFKDQLMEVKTNKEYHAMQAEIATAEAEVERLEDQLLERMLEGDELTAGVNQADQELTAEQAAVAKERVAFEARQQQLGERLRQLTAERPQLTTGVNPQAMSLFETVLRQRKGIAVVEARDGLCTSCQVRLRPQLFNDIRLNNALIQCESCQRILYSSLESSATT